MGGQDKGSDFSLLRGLMKQKVTLLVLLGEAKERIEHDMGDSVRTVTVSSLGEAVEVSAANASAGDVVLLSPGCASFDMFADFEERGREFKKAVRGLVK